MLLVNIEEWWLFLKIHIVPNYCSFVRSDKIPFLRGVIKICCNSSSSHPPLLLQLSTVRQWKFPPFANVRESTKLQSSLWRKKKNYCHFRNTTKSSIRLASRNEIKFLRSGGTKTVQQREQMLLLRERGMKVVVDHQLEFLPPFSFLLVATVRGFGRLLPKKS